MLQEDFGEFIALLNSHDVDYLIDLLTSVTGRQAA